MVNVNSTDLEATILEGLLEDLENENIKLFEFYNSLEQVERLGVLLGIRQRSDQRHKKREERLVDIESNYTKTKKKIHDIECQQAFEDDWLKTNIEKIGTDDYELHKSNLAKCYFNLRNIKDNSDSESKYTQEVYLINQDDSKEYRYKLNDFIVLIKTEIKNRESVKFTKYLEGRADYLKRRLQWRKALKNRRLEKLIEITKENRKKIKKIVSDKKINYLVHFTTENALNSILHEGLVTRSDKRFDMRYVAVDKQRIDLHYDCLSTSISFPNYKMFFSKRNTQKGFIDQNGEPHVIHNWVVILLKAEVLYKFDCKFLNDNAASNRVNLHSKKYNSYKDFIKMFVGEEDRRGIPKNYPTNPQAEVLVRGNIPTKFFEKIIFNSDDMCNKYSSLTDVSCAVDCSFFNPRRDWRVWQTH